ncbi:MAG: hypothetical protein GY869_28775 [Planctomycetes bacterium]|nr:hypothetical protein [Planctomycetota bacterium]
METFILIAGLIAAATGTLVLLLSLAQKRAQLVRAYNIKLEIEERERMIEANQAEMENPDGIEESSLTPVTAGVD